MIKSRRMRWAGHLARMGEKNNAYRILVGKPEGKRPLGRTRRRWVDNIKIILRKIGWDSVDWVDLAQDRDQWRALVNTSVELLVRKISPPQGCYLHTEQHKRSQTSILRFGFEPTNPGFKQANTVHALDRADYIRGPVPPVLNERLLMLTAKVDDTVVVPCVAYANPRPQYRRGVRKEKGEWSIVWVTEGSERGEGGIEHCVGDRGGVKREKGE
ncbi:hypothetical protein B7P43_G10971 [Cryptotermes secundus]|uniref:Uncharacterized protein n=1 Tax=Cryptotermes secundus TaxID=105785 RepID=A0A2J7R5N6_9NEOP|nr:hypothetical protein B7P43_G10971 [Cryptotermes secundus]